MLAKKYSDFVDRFQFPCHVQPKLNGVRMLYNNGQLQSRDEHLWKSNILRKIRKALSEVPSTYILDGELYVHGMSLQEINSRASVNRVDPHPHEDDVQYHIFDIVDVEDPYLPFSERINLLYLLFHRSLDAFPKYIQMVPTVEAEHKGDADYLYFHYKQINFEGLMYRVSSAPYGFLSNCSNKENRWNVLLKRKSELDANCIIVDVHEGSGKYQNMVGSLVLEFPGSKVRFNAGSGLTDEQRQKYMDQPPIGHVSRILYEMLSDDGVPLKPIVDCVFDV